MGGKPYSFALKTKGNSKSRMASMSLCHTIFANYPNHIGRACWQSFYLAILFGFDLLVVFAIAISPP
jgi:hypothetical protein